MKKRVDYDRVIDQLSTCERAGLIDRFTIRTRDLVIIQGRHAHRIPLEHAQTFLAGMVLYAQEAGIDTQHSMAA